MKGLIILAILVLFDICRTIPVSPRTDIATNAITDNEENKNIENALNEIKPVAEGESDYIFETSTSNTPVKDEVTVDATAVIKDPENQTSRAPDDVNDVDPNNETPRAPDDFNGVNPKNESSLPDLKDKIDNDNQDANDNSHQDLETILKDIGQQKDIPRDGDRRDNDYSKRTNLSVRIFNRPLVSKVYEKRTPIHLVVNPFLLLWPDLMQKTSDAEYRANVPV